MGRSPESRPETGLSVCMLTSSYPRYGGDRAGTFVQSLAESLAERGHRIHVLAPMTGDCSQAIAQTSVKVDFFRYAPTPRLQVMGYGEAMVGDRHLRLASYALVIPYLAIAATRLVRYARATGCDLLHAHWVLPNGLAAAAASRLTGLPRVVSLHGSDVFVAEKGATFRAAARMAFGRGVPVAACSADLANRALGLGADGVTTSVVPYGVDVSKFSPDEAGASRLRTLLGIAPEAPVVLALGRLVHKKGFEYLIRAVPTLVSRHPALVVVIAGDGGLLSELRTLAMSLGVADRVFFPGRVDWREVPSYLTMADVFTLPSVRDVTGNVDGLPNVLLEAMAAGKAVVASNVGGVGQVVRDGNTGLLVGEKSTEDLVRAISTLLSLHGFRASLGGAARGLVEREFTWDGAAERYERIYYGLLTPEGRTPARFGQMMRQGTK